MVTTLGRCFTVGSHVLRVLLLAGVAGAVLAVAIAATASASSASPGVLGESLSMATGAQAPSGSASAVAWGTNNFGELGDGTREAINQPVNVSGLSEVAAVAAGYTHSLALLPSGSLVAWGNNEVGQLGTGNRTASDVPVAVSGVSEATAIAASEENSMALLKSGHVMAWGIAYIGELGDGSDSGPESCPPPGNCSTKPVEVSGLSEATAISAGSRYGEALRRNGSVMSWGYNQLGQLGNGSTTNTDLPVEVSGLSTAAAISAGGYHSLALLTSGQVMAWGGNFFGQLGNGSTVNSDTPVQVKGLGEVTAVASGYAHSLALLRNGTVVAWGGNRSGQLGDGTMTGPETCESESGESEPCSRTPVAVQGLSEVVAIAAGGDFFGSISLALLKNGKVMAWGSSNGLGNGATTDSDVPTPVDALSGVSAISAGASHSLAIGAPVPVRAPLPTVTGVEPNHGPPGGGTSVTIKGTNFSEATAVKFGSKNATSFKVETETSITATAPPGTGVVEVSVTTPSGQSATSYEHTFNYGPILNSVGPNYGPPPGGTTVTLTGTNLGGATAVMFGSVGAASFTVNSETSITAVSPAGTGDVAITITTPAGTSSPSGDPGNDQFNYGPFVSTVRPRTGPAAGGYPVAITGNNFTGATAVKFGSVSAASFSVESDTMISAVVPAYAGGSASVYVSVTTPGGVSVPQGSSILPESYFRYMPTVTSVAPDGGPVSGGNRVTIGGTGFTSVRGGDEFSNYVTAVRFGSVKSTSYSVTGEGTISATAPPGTGTVDVTVETFGGTSPTGPADRYAYTPPPPPAPTVTSISPSSGEESGGRSVTITGNNFSGAEAVQFGSVSASSFKVESSTAITAVSPAGKGKVDVTVTAGGATSATSSADQFRYDGRSTCTPRESEAPAVSSVQPSSGPAAGGNSVTITGSRFHVLGFCESEAIRVFTVRKVFFGSMEASSVTEKAENEVIAIAPPGTGTVDVTVETFTTSQASSADHYTYTPPVAPAPTVTKIEPSSGPRSGGSSVTITGTNFSGVTAVRFGEANATSFKWESETSIIAVAPAGTGTVDVTVVTGSTSPTRAADRYTYIPAANTHWYRNGSRSEEGVRVPFMSWGMLALTSSKGGASTECQSVVAGYVENPAGAAAGAFEREGVEATDAFSLYNCTNSECEAAGGSAGVLAEDLPWAGALSEEIKGTPRIASAGVRLFVHCRIASSPPTEQPGTGQYAGREERRSIEYDLAGAATCTTGAGGAMMPKEVNGTSTEKPSKTEFAAGVASGELECGGAGKLAMTGNLKIMGYGEAELLSVKSP